MSAQHKNDLLDTDAHFAFGKNWASYADLIGEREIAEAERALLRLLPAETLKRKRFLDIGCGSGLHSLAALRLGVGELLATDIDPDSVATTRSVVDRHAPGVRYAVEKVSVFDLDPARTGLFDVVYSWGVLHHTGDMDRALRQAASLVAPGGVFAFALYRKTLLCGLWKLEKRWYAHAGSVTQKRLRACYLVLFRVAMQMTGRRFEEYVENYASSRGMDFYHDVHDWLGGYPYESISPGEVAKKMTELGLEPVRSFVHRSRFSRLFGIHHGIFGSGCDEYVYKRPAKPASEDDACAA